MLQIRKVSTFSASTPGFRPEWWAGVVKTQTAAFSLFQGFEEVARASVEPNYRLYDGYPGLGSRPIITMLEKIEVRSDQRGSGLGRQFVGLLVAQYPESVWAAFSNADDFWIHVGWELNSRSDGDKAFWPLFSFKG